MIQPSFKRKENGVPDIYRKDIEEIGICILNDYKPELLSHPQELDLDHFVEFYLGMNIDYQYLSHDGRFLGMCVFNDTNKAIVFDPGKRKAEYFSVSAGTVLLERSMVTDSRQKHRSRFTLGHEASHYILDQDYYSCHPDQLNLFELPDEPMVKCKVADIEGPFRGDPKNWDDETRMEWQCDELSSVLLMNRPSVRELMKRIGGACNETLLNFRRVEAMVRIYNVSYKAAELRLRHLNYINESDETDYSSARQFAAFI